MYLILNTYVCMGTTYIILCTYIKKNLLLCSALSVKSVPRCWVGRHYILLWNGCVKFELNDKSL